MARLKLGERFNAVIGRLLSTAGLLPGLALVWTVFALVQGTQPPETGWAASFPVLVGLVLALLSWLVFAVVTIRYGYANAANAAQFLELKGRFTQLDARIQAVCTGEAAGTAGCLVAIAHRNSIKTTLDANPSGIAWVTGEGYVALWQRMHGAEEGLMECSPISTIVAEAQYDRARLTGSTIDNRDGFLKASAMAIATLAPYLAGSLDVQVPAAADAAQPADDAKAVLRTIRRAVSEFRDDRSAGLVRLRRRMTQSLVLTGTTAYLVLALAILAGLKEEQILTGCAYFLVGAIVGLLHRVHIEMSLRSEVEDFGLSTARLLNAPVLSGLAGLGGVVLTALLIVPPMGLAVINAPDGALAYGNIFTIQTYPAALAVAAAFGLTPGLLFDRLKQVGEGLKTDIQKSSAAGEADGSS